MNTQAYIDDCALQLKKLKSQADRAIAQTKDAHFFATIDPESNSIAIIMKHLAGNMKSRWTDFFTSDGEKPNRNRDSEFEMDGVDTREKILATWEEGWKITLGTISIMKPTDLEKTITIRGEPHSVPQAINRQLTHYAAHIGQIVLLAKHYAGADWQTLSIPRGKSKEFEVSKRGEQYKPKQVGGGLTSTQPDL
jgi:hypothetical protein